MNLIILGPQGSGKGTQAKKLAQKFDLVHIDMGKFLREVAAMDTPLGQEVWQIQNVTKTLVPSRILEEAFTVKFNSIPREQGIVFDGVPRTMDQAEYLEKVIREFGRKINKVIVVKISPEESIRRVSKRWVCEKCKETLIMGKDIESENDLCPKCSGKIMQRADDTKEGLKKRLLVYENETVPVIEYFQEKDLVVEIDGEQAVEKVFEDILKELKKTSNE